MSRLINWTEYGARRDSISVLLGFLRWVTALGFKRTRAYQWNLFEAIS